MDWELFFRLWLQKMLRNVASLKFQFLILLYIPVIYGMFHFKPNSEVWITPALGLGFLGGGFITLATSRLLAKTTLTETKEDLECEKDANN